MQYSNRAYLLIGGNIGDRLAYLNRARALLQLHSGKELQCSSVYETAAWGIEDQSSFLNQALLISTSLTAMELLHQILQAEKEIGRERNEKYGARIIDIDILLFNEDIFDEPDLVVPHPMLPSRRFALAPLSEIAAAYVHPVLKKTISELLEECSDPLPVHIFEN